MLHIWAPLCGNIAASVAGNKGLLKDKGLTHEEKRAKKLAETGLPEIPWMFCGHMDPNEFDLSLHLLEKHRRQLVELPIGKGSLEYRADYAVAEGKKRLANVLRLFPPLGQEDSIY